MKRFTEKGYRFLAERIIVLLRKINIFRRLMIAFLFLVVAPCGFLTLFTFHYYVGEIETNMDKFISLLVQNVNVQVTEKFARYESMATSAYTDSTLITMLEENRELSSLEDEESQTLYRQNTEAIGKKLKALANNNRNIVNFQIITPYDQYVMIDSYGHKVGAYVRDLPGFLQSEFYQKTLEQNGYPEWFDTTRVSDLFYRDASSSFGLADYLTMMQNIYGEDRRVLGVIVINIELNAVLDSLRSYSFYGSGNTLLLSKNGIITGVNGDLSAPNLTHLGKQLETVFNYSQGTIRENIDGTNVFAAYKNIPYTDIYIAHIVNQDELLRNAYHIRNLCLLLTGILILASAVAAYFATVSISNPVNQLKKSMKEFTENRFDSPCPLSGNDEITVLGQNFNEMADNTRKLIEKIYVAELRQKTLELSKSNAELNALQMQINPHFLYNTLDIIRWEAMYQAGGESKVSHMIEVFCQLMRMGIKERKDIISVQEELEHVKVYTEVVNFRHRMAITLEVNVGFDTARYLLPKLTLQPLMENAVLHAFSESGERPPAVQIGGSIEGCDMIITVADNGCGMEEIVLRDLQKSLSGEALFEQSIGLRNVNQRIRLYYGERYGVSVWSKAGAGTTVTLTLPAQTHDETKGEPQCTTKF